MIKSNKVNEYTQKSVGLEPGIGASDFGVCITELVDGIVNVLRAEEYARPDFNEMTAITVRLLNEYDIRFDNRCRVFVDRANHFISALKQEVNEAPTTRSRFNTTKRTII